jgi:hypothetical protein
MAAAYWTRWATVGRSPDGSKLGSRIASCDWAAARKMECITRLGHSVSVALLAVNGLGNRFGEHWLSRRLVLALAGYGDTSEISLACDGFTTACLGTPEQTGPRNRVVGPRVKDGVREHEMLKAKQAFGLAVLGLLAVLIGCGGNSSGTPVGVLPSTDSTAGSGTTAATATTAGTGMMVIPSGAGTISKLKTR